MKYIANIKKSNSTPVKYLLGVLLLLFQSTLFYSQTLLKKTDSLATQLHHLAKNEALESVYLQTSKGIYETGEDLWFKGYVLDSQYLTPSSQIKTLYVQLIEDQTKKAVWEEKYEIENGFVDGHLYIQDTLQVGSYTLAAYTPHSIYNDQQSIKSIRKLHIVKNISSYLQAKQQDTITPHTTIEKTIAFQLFPEGGHLVSGIESNVAFKAVDSKGNPKSVSGTVYENNKPLTTFKSTYAGMGSFSFKPNQHKSYHIVLDSSAIKTHYALPTIKLKGYALQMVNNTKEEIIFKVQKNTNRNKETVFLRVQIRGVVYSIAKTVITKKQLINIPLKDFPQGIAEVTLFNQNLQPLAERLVYLNQDQKLYINTELSKDVYKTKEKAILKLKVTDQNNQPVVAHLGLSIYDKLYQNPKDKKTIESHYHLSTQLKGKLYNPSYYFNKKNKNRKQALDLLLLTQGWRAYQWTEDNLKQETQKKNLVINDTLTGKLYAKNKKTQSLLSQQYVMAFTADKGSIKSFIEVDSIGRFTVYPQDIQQAKNGYLYLKLLLNDPKNKINITINDPSFTTINRLRKQKGFSYPQAPKQKPQPYTPRPFVLTNDVNKLEEVLIKGKKKRVFRDKYLGKLDSLARLQMNTDYVCKRNFLNCTSCRNGTRPVEGYIYIIWLGDGIHHGPGSTPFNGSETKTIEYRYPQLTEAELLKKFNSTRIKGYYGNKTFYSPIYDAVEPTDGFPDYRNTLYWKPDILTNTKGEVQLEFCISDINSKFLGIIEGVSGDGQLGQQTFEFMVRK